MSFLRSFTRSGARAAQAQAQETQMENARKELEKKFEQEKPQIVTKLNDEINVFQPKITQVYKKSSPDAQAFMREPTEEAANSNPEMIKRLVSELSAEGVPGMDLLNSTVGPYGVPAGADVLVNLFMTISVFVDPSLSRQGSQQVEDFEDARDTLSRASSFASAAEMPLQSPDSRRQSASGFSRPSSYGTLASEGASTSAFEGAKNPTLTPERAKVDPGVPASPTSFVSARTQEPGVPESPGYDSATSGPLMKSPATLATEGKVGQEPAISPLPGSNVMEQKAKQAAAKAGLALVSDEKEEDEQAQVGHVPQEPELTVEELKDLIAMGEAQLADTEEQEIEAEALLADEEDSAALPAQAYSKATRTKSKVALAKALEAERQRAEMEAPEGADESESEVAAGSKVSQAGDAESLKEATLNALNANEAAIEQAAVQADTIPDSKVVKLAIASAPRSTISALPSQASVDAAVQEASEDMAPETGSGTSSLLSMGAQKVGLSQDHVEAALKSTGNQLGIHEETINTGLATLGASSSGSEATAGSKVAGVATVAGTAAVAAVGAAVAALGGLVGFGKAGAPEAEKEEALANGKATATEAGATAGLPEEATEAGLADQSAIVNDTKNLAIKTGQAVSSAAGSALGAAQSAVGFTGQAVSSAAGTALGAARSVVGSSDTEPEDVKGTPKVTDDDDDTAIALALAVKEAPNAPVLVNEPKSPLAAERSRGKPPQTDQTVTVSRFLPSEDTLMSAAQTVGIPNSTVDTGLATVGLKKGDHEMSATEKAVGVAGLAGAAVAGGLVALGKAFGGTETPKAEQEPEPVVAPLERKPSPPPVDVPPLNVTPKDVELAVALAVKEAPNAPLTPGKSPRMRSGPFTPFSAALGSTAGEGTTATEAQAKPADAVTSKQVPQPLVDETRIKKAAATMGIREEIVDYGLSALGVQAGATSAPTVLPVGEEALKQSAAEMGIQPETVDAGLSALNLTSPVKGKEKGGLAELELGAAALAVGAAGTASEVAKKAEEASGPLEGQVVGGHTAVRAKAKHEEDEEEDVPKKRARSFKGDEVAEQESAPAFPFPASEGSNTEPLQTSSFSIPQLSSDQQHTLKEAGKSLGVSESTVDTGLSTVGLKPSEEQEPLSTKVLGVAGVVGAATVAAVGTAGSFLGFGKEATAESGEGGSESELRKSPSGRNIDRKDSGVMPVNSKKKPLELLAALEETEPVDEIAPLGLKEKPLEPLAPATEAPILEEEEEAEEEPEGVATSEVSKGKEPEEESSQVTAVSNEALLKDAGKRIGADEATIDAGLATLGAKPAQEAATLSEKAAGVTAVIGSGALAAREAVAQQFGATTQPTEPVAEHRGAEATTEATEAVAELPGATSEAVAKQAGAAVAGATTEPRATAPLLSEASLKLAAAEEGESTAVTDPIETISEAPVSPAPGETALKQAAGQLGIAPSTVDTGLSALGVKPKEGSSEEGFTEKAVAVSAVVGSAALAAGAAAAAAVRTAWGGTPPKEEPTLPVTTQDTLTPVPPPIRARAEPAEVTQLKRATSSPRAMARPASPRILPHRPPPPPPTFQSQAKVEEEKAEGDTIVPEASAEFKGSFQAEESEREAKAQTAGALLASSPGGEEPHSGSTAPHSTPRTLSVGTEDLKSAKESSEAPGADVSKVSQVATPRTVLEPMPSPVVTEKSPLTETEKTPLTVIEKTPVTLTEKTPLTVTEETPLTAIEKTTPTLTEESTPKDQPLTFGVVKPEENPLTAASFFSAKGTRTPESTTPKTVSPVKEAPKFSDAKSERPLDVPEKTGSALAGEGLLEVPEKRLPAAMGSVNLSPMLVEEGLSKGAPELGQEAVIAEEKAEVFVPAAGGSVGKTGEVTAMVVPLAPSEQAVATKFVPATETRVEAGKAPSGAEEGVVEAPVSGTKVEASGASKTATHAGKLKKSKGGSFCGCFRPTTVE